MSEISKFQKGEMRVIHRSEIKFLVDNPQGMLDEEKHRLAKSLKTHGLLDRIVWNEATGHCVGGNHRLRELDKLENGYDYKLEVLAIRVSEKKERAIALQLNNRTSQGDLRPDILAKWIKEDKVDFEEGGYSPSDLWKMFGKAEQAVDILGADPQKLADLGELQRKSQEVMDRLHDRVDGRDDVNFYFRVISRNQGERDQFLELLRVFFGLREEAVANLNVDVRLFADLIDGMKTATIVQGMPVGCPTQDRCCTFVFDSAEQRKAYLEANGLPNQRFLDGKILAVEVQEEPPAGEQPCSSESST